MNAELGIAGLICVVMAFGHETMGVVWVLPHLSEERVPRTPFGPQSMTLSMIRVTWHIVSIFVLALGVLLLTIAWDATADLETLVLRWLAAFWLTATAMALWVARRALRNGQFFRLPVPLLWVVVAVLCWSAST